MADAWFEAGSVDNDYSMIDLKTYGKHISGESRLTPSEREPEPADASSPYFMALSDKEQNESFNEASKKSSKIDPQDEESTLLQINSHVKGGNGSSEDKAAKGGENPWESMITMNVMTKSVLDKSAPKKAPGKSDAEKKQEEAKQAEFEKKAIQDARNELLQPENIMAMQTNSQLKVNMRTKTTHIEEIMNDKEGELMGQELLRNA